MAGPRWLEPVRLARQRLAADLFRRTIPGSGPLYTVYMAGRERATQVLSVRVTADLGRRLAREARRTRRTRGETARALLEQALAGRPVDDPAAEARRQSMRASRVADDRAVLDFIAAAADLSGWR